MTLLWFIFLLQISLSSAVRIPLYHNAQALRKRDVDSLDWLTGAADALRLRYGSQGEKDTVTGHLGRRGLGSRRSKVSKRKPASDLSIGNALNDAIYYIDVSIGTPAQTFSFIADTGSADFWVATTACSDCPSSVSAFNPAGSNTSVLSDTAFSIHYGTGSASGLMAQDTLAMGEFRQTGGSIALVDQSESILRDSINISGIMGLAWQSIATSKNTPFWEALCIDGTMDQNLFSMALTRSKSLPSNATSGDKIPGGVFTLGGIDTSLFEGELNYMPLLTKGFWMIQMDGVTVDGLGAMTRPAAVALDSGTSLIAAPPADVANIFAKIEGSAPSTDPRFEGYYEFPCGATTNVSFTFGGIAYDINPTDFNLGRVRDGVCLGSIFGLDTGSNGTSTLPGWIIGDSFLKSVYTVYTFDPPTVGIANLARNFNSNPELFLVDGSEKPTTISLSSIATPVQTDAAVANAATPATQTAVTTATPTPEQTGISNSASSMMIDSGLLMLLLPQLLYFVL